MFGSHLTLATTHGPEALGVFILLFWCLMIPVWFALLGFWIWMIVDCATREKNEGNEKVVWILVIVLASWIGALIYFFVRRPVRKRELGR